MPNILFHNFSLVLNTYLPSSKTDSYTSKDISKLQGVRSTTNLKIVAAIEIFDFIQIQCQTLKLTDYRKLMKGLQGFRVTNTGINVGR